MNDIFNWLDLVLSPDYEPCDDDYEILFHLRLAQTLIKGGVNNENKRKRVKK